VYAAFATGATKTEEPRNEASNEDNNFEDLKLSIFSPYS
jgi:hypothetical protein